jgi:hypothetical protein
MAKPKQAGLKKREPAKKQKKLRRQKLAEDKPEQPTPVQISAAKGRPTLVWVGKKPLRHFTGVFLSPVSYYLFKVMEKDRMSNGAVLRYVEAYGFKGASELLRDYQARKS